MEWAYHFVPYAWVCGVAAGEVVIEHVEDEVSSERYHNDAYACKVELCGLFFDCRKSGY